MIATSFHNDFTFTTGQAFRHGFTIVRIVQDLGEQLVLENLTSGAKKTVFLPRLLQDYRSSSLLPCTAEEVEAALRPDFDPDDALIRELNVPLDDLSKATIEVGLKKIRYIRALRELGYTTLRPKFILNLDYEKLVRQWKDESAPKLSTIYTCSLRIEARDGDWRAAFPNFKDRGGKHKYRWTVPAETAFKLLVDDLNSDTKAVISPVLAEESLKKILREKTAQPQLFDIMPSRSSIERRLRETFGEYEIYKRKHGKAAADKEFRHWYPRDSAVLPLEVGEFDDKDSRCFLYDEVTGLPCGRAYVTAGVDQNSAVPLGFSISDRHRNVLSAKQAFLNAILPYDQSDPAYQGVKSPSEFYGRPGIAIFDNALYNHAKELELFVAEVSGNTVVGWSKPRTPTEKSTIEDFNGRMDEGCFARLPGYGGPKGTVNLLTNGLEQCCLTVQDFRQHLLVWSYDKYCNNPRDGYTPRERWRIGMQHITPRLPKIVNAALLAATLSAEKKLRPEGVQLLKGLSYQNQELLLLRRYLGHNAGVKFRYNPYRLGEIYVLDPRTSRYLVVPSTTPQYTRSLSIYQHRLVLKWNSERGRKHPSLNEYLDAVEALQSMVQQLRFSKKRRERAIGKKLANELDEVVVNESSTASALILPSTEIVTDLEATICDLDEVELEGDEDEDDWTFSL